MSVSTCELPVRTHVHITLFLAKFLREMEEAAEADQRARAAGVPTIPHTRNGVIAPPTHQRVASVPAHLYKHSAPLNERTQLIIRRHSIMGETGAFSHDLRYVGSAPVAGGTILGIHNLAIVFPQFLVRSNRLRLSPETALKFPPFDTTSFPFFRLQSSLLLFSGLLIGVHSMIPRISTWARTAYPGFFAWAGCLLW